MILTWGWGGGPRFQSRPALQVTTLGDGGFSLQVTPLGDAGFEMPDSAEWDMVLPMGLFAALFAVSVSRVLEWYLARKTLKALHVCTHASSFDPYQSATPPPMRPVPAEQQSATPPPPMSPVPADIGGGGEQRSATPPPVAAEIGGGGKQQAPVQFLVVKVPECRGASGGNLPLWRARDAAAEQLRALQTRAQGGEFSGMQLMRVEAGLRGFGVEEAMLWLRAQPPFPKVFFMNPEGSHMCAGAGAAHLVTGDGELHAPLLPEGTPPSFRYYGGSRFDAGALVGVEWEKFGGHFFVLPQVPWRPQHKCMPDG